MCVGRCGGSSTCHSSLCRRTECWQASPDTPPLCRSQRKTGLVEAPSGDSQRTYRGITDSLVCHCILSSPHASNSAQSSLSLLALDGQQWSTLLSLFKHCWTSSTRSSSFSSLRQWDRFLFLSEDGSFWIFSSMYCLVM